MTNNEYKSLEERAENEPTEFDGRVALAHYEKEQGHLQDDKEEADRISLSAAHYIGSYSGQLVERQIQKRKEEEEKTREFRKDSLWVLYQKNVNDLKIGLVTTAVGTALAATPGLIMGNDLGTLVSAVALTLGTACLLDYTHDYRSRIEKNYQAYRHYGGRNDR